MRSRVAAASAATLLAAASLAPVEAQAAGQNTLYVNNGSSACTDSGSGTLDVPYCSIQAAADIADPGDVVKVSDGTYAPFTVTRSGTAASPIVFTTTAGAIQKATAVHVPSFDVSAAGHVRIQGFTVTPDSGSNPGVTIDGGSDITLANDAIASLETPGTRLHVTGAASGVTVVRSSLGNVLVDGGSTGTVLTTNWLYGDYGSQITVDGATDTAVTSNSIYGCDAAISVTGSATDTSIENNILDDIDQVDFVNPDGTPPCPTPTDGIQVNAGSAASTTSDYNDVYSSGYNWAGTHYSDASALSGATGQGRHDVDSAQGTSGIEGSPAIDSADSAATGEQTTDYYGLARVTDPTVAQTGAGPYDYYDRGAYEFQDPYRWTPNSGITMSASQAPVGATVDVHTNYQDTWSDPIADYEYVFSGPNGSSSVVTTATDVKLSLPTVGKYGVELYVEYAGSGSFTDTGFHAIVNAVTPAPLTPVLSVLTETARSASASVYSSTDAWNITSATFDFGDGTPPQAETGTQSATHVYAHAGTYTVTATVTDAGGNTAKAAGETYTTEGSDYTPYGPARILDTRHGTGAKEAKIPTGGHVALKIAGTGSIPSGVTAVALNVTVVDAVGNGYISVEPDGTPAGSSNLNYLAGQTRTNYAIVPVAADGMIDLYDVGPAGGSTDLIADVSGYFKQTAGSGYTAVTPQRILDTRHGTGAPAKQVGPASGLPVGIAGADSIPAGVTAVAVHVTVADATGNGWIAAEPDGAGTPSTSILNYLKGQTVSNTVIVPVAADGEIEFYNGGGAGSVDLIADVSGYFSADSAAAYVPVTPYRSWDTRKAGPPLTADSTTTYDLLENAPAGSPYIPPGATFIANLTATDLTANGVITAYPAGAAQPAVSNLNYLAGQTVAGLSLLGTTMKQPSTVAVRNDSAGHGDLIVDVFGFFSG